MSLDANYWRERAGHARVVTEWIDDEEATPLLLEVADRCDEIARIAESNPLLASPHGKPRPNARNTTSASRAPYPPL